MFRISVPIQILTPIWSVNSSLFLGRQREWSFGFGYGACWASFLLLFMSLVLLICDRESEEIFYKERQVEEEEEEEEEEDA